MAFELTLPDMTCGHCVKTVTQAVRSVDPQAHLEVDLGRHVVTIESLRPAEEFTRALAEEGYPATA
jgi:copper chaperone